MALPAKEYWKAASDNSKLEKINVYMLVQATTVSTGQRIITMGPPEGRSSNPSGGNIDYCNESSRGNMLKTPLEGNHARFSRGELNLEHIGEEFLKQSLSGGNIDVYRNTS